jgi:hypothetical protein
MIISAAEYVGRINLEFGAEAGIKSIICDIPLR